MKSNFIHKEMAAGRWREFPLAWQMANIGADVGRAINWKEKGDSKSAYMAFERALELFDLTIQDPKNRDRLKEITRARETFVDFLSLTISTIKRRN
jgi:hypothetical protein